MTEPLPFRHRDRRRPHISHEELRRQLIAADEDRYRLYNELRERDARAEPSRARAAWPQRRRRLAVGVGTVLVTGLAGGLVWEMCPSSARAGDESRSVRVVTAQVTPQLLVSERPAISSAAKPVKVSVRSHVRTSVAHKLQPRIVAVRRVDRQPRPRAVPRPLSPGEFGRPRISAY
jgi:hypothetical protein